jgi:glucose/arabinose dehydrogenase
MTVFVRGKIDKSNHWVEEQLIYRAPSELYTPSGAHYGTRFLFDNAGHVFYSLGERGDMTNAQDLSKPLGKIHRVNSSAAFAP